MAAKRSMRWSVLGLGLALLLHAACVAAPAKTKQIHVLNRIGYGPDAWSLARIQQLGSVEAYIEEQLHPELLDDSALEAEIASLYPVETMSYGLSRNTYNEYTGNPDTGPYAPIRDATRAKVLRAVKSKRQLEQVLVDFWFNHFNVSDVEEARWGFLTLERDAIRPNVFGSFETMLRATAKNPGMLDYLDNALNFKDGFVYLNATYGLNENYPREVMELHTLGVDGGYTQADVREVARAFTGWTLPTFVSTTSNGFQFLSQGHDRNAKTVIGVALPANRGLQDGDDVIHLLATHPKTAEHISRKLCQRFVSETPPEALVQAAAATFLATNGDLREVMRTILLSPEFLGLTYARSKVKRPLVFVASLGRAVGVDDDAYFAEGDGGPAPGDGRGSVSRGTADRLSRVVALLGRRGAVRRARQSRLARCARRSRLPSGFQRGDGPDARRHRRATPPPVHPSRDRADHAHCARIAGGGIAGERARQEAAATMLVSPDFLVH